jgi:hypothetical protein
MLNRERPLSSSNSTSLTSTALPRVQPNILTTNNCFRLLNNLLALSQDQFNVARVGHVWVDLYCYMLISIHPWEFGECLHDHGHGKFVGVVWEPD